MSRPTKAQADSGWEKQVRDTVQALLDSVEEIEDDEALVLVDRNTLRVVDALCKQGQGVDDVEVWIWENAPVALRRAKKLLRNPAFLLAARSKK